MTKNPASTWSEILASESVNEKIIYVTTTDIIFNNMAGKNVNLIFVFGLNKV